MRVCGAQLRAVNKAKAKQTQQEEAVEEENRYVLIFRTAANGATMPSKRHAQRMHVYMRRIRRQMSCRDSRCRKNENASDSFTNDEHCHTA